MEHNPKRRLVHVTTVAKSLRFFQGQIEFMQARGFAVEAVAASSKELEQFGSEQAIPVHGANLRRSISPLQDLKALVELVQIFRTMQPAIVHASTPKSGLLSMIAASIHRRPKRIYHILGLPYLTADSRKRSLLKLSERVSCLLAHRVFCVSHSIRTIAIDDRLCAADKIVVLGNGSVNGVDALHTFNPANHPPEARAELRGQYGCGEEHFLVGFVGRVVREKGIEELAAAWKAISDYSSSARLFIVGDREAHDPISTSTWSFLQLSPSVICVGHVDDPSDLYSILDLVVLPTYREGFGNVLIEAASMGLPVVASNVPGCVDSVRPGVTGTLVEPRDVESLTSAILLYMQNAALRKTHGEAGRERVLRDFRREIVWEAMYKEYANILGGMDLGLPSLQGLKGEGK